MLRRIIQFRQRQVPIDDTDDEEETYESEGEEEDCKEHDDDKHHRWLNLEHNGPWFSSIDREMSKEEILRLYRQVPLHHRRGGRFWKSFNDLCIARGWKPSEAREFLETEELSPTPQTKTTKAGSHQRCFITTTGVDGNPTRTEEPITNWRMEPPTVFIGRGNHPLRGCLRRRVVPEDVVLNLGQGVRIPPLPRGRKWKAVVHRQDCGWLWSWEDPLTRKIKYVYPGSVSRAHAEIERKKFDEAAELGKYVTKIRRFYTTSFERGEYLELACVLYLIDNLGIRIGNDNNATVDGATTLRVENVQPLDGHRTIWVRFLGKDSVEYDNKIACDPLFVGAIRQLSSGKGSDDFLFPNVNARIVNSYLQSYHPSLKAKAFRTFNATQRFKQSVNEYRPSRGDPLSWFKRCVMEVAVFCNHKRISTLRKRQEQYSPITSITNYIDPRVVVEWAGKAGVPLNKIYSKTLLERFSWAIA
jgi:hypothetical protein